MDLVELFNDFFDIYAFSEFPGNIKINKITIWHHFILTFDDAFRMFDIYKNLSEFNKEVLYAAPNNIDYKQIKQDLELIEPIVGSIQGIIIYCPVYKYWIDDIRIVNINGTILCNYIIEPNVYYPIDQYEKLKLIFSIRSNMIVADKSLIRDLID